MSLCFSVLLYSIQKPTFYHISYTVKSEWLFTLNQDTCISHVYFYDQRKVDEEINRKFYNKVILNICVFFRVV